ncbi:MAG: hypothetical protein U1U88_001504 [Lawsonella clevelandensis]
MNARPAHRRHPAHLLRRWRATVPGGHDIADRIADYLRAHADRYGLIVTTQDWHINPGSHFSDTPDFVDTWPPHGQASAPNAELRPRLQAALEALRTSRPTCRWRQCAKASMRQLLRV